MKEYKVLVTVHTEHAFIIQAANSKEATTNAYHLCNKKNRIKDYPETFRYCWSSKKVNMLGKALAESNIIEKNIPLPEIRPEIDLENIAQDKIRDTMNIGDSIWFASNKGSHSVHLNAFMKGLTTYSKNTGRRFSQRTLIENGIHGTRVWRMK